MTSGVKMPPLVLRKLPPARKKPRMPAHQWKDTAERRERMAERALSRLASRIPDQEALDAILGDYPVATRGHVLGRIRQYLKFETTTLTAAVPSDADTTIVVGGAPTDGPMVLVDSERRLA